MSTLVSARSHVEEGTSKTARSGKILPKGWPDFLLQLGLFVVADIFYELSRTLAKGNIAAAFVHARDIVHVEKSLGVFTELDVQKFALSHGWVLSVADFTYFHAHFAVTVIFLFWLYLRRNQYYYFVRNIIFAANILALIGYISFPAAPPRMLTDLGFTDTLERFATLNHDSGVIALLANPFAAVPSLHTCYALVIGLTCFFLFRWMPIRVLALFYPALIVFSIVATGNHFWTDAVLGAIVATIATGAAWLVERRWPSLPESARRRLRIEPAGEPSPT
jgi:hypothetical protein